MTHAFICDAIRTPIGRYGGGLASVRADDLASLTLRALMERNDRVDWTALDDVVLGCANQAGEDNRNVARMAALLSGLPATVSGSIVGSNGLIKTGMIGSETPTSITLRQSGGKQETVLRSDIDEMAGSGKSLMPEGFEKKITPEEMADLIAFLLRGTSP